MGSKWVAAALGVVVLGAAGFGGWWFLVRNDAPPPVDLGSAVAGLSTAVPGAATPGAATPGAATPGVGDGTGADVAPTADSTLAADLPLEGTWTVDPTQSFVGYRIDEQLAQVGATTAVGRTSDVSGTLEFDGTAITAVSVTANLRALRSDDSRRDGQLRRQALETDRFPEATFVLAEPIVLGHTPGDGEVVVATAVGDLTLHGVTRRVELGLQGQRAGAYVVVVGATVVRLADYDIDQPRAALVLAVSEEATLELELVFHRS